jgi:hypothetical protein
MQYKLVNLTCPYCKKPLRLAWDKKNSLQKGICPYCGEKAQVQLSLRRSLVALPIAFLVAWMLILMIPFVPALFIGTMVFAAGAIELGKANPR